MATEPERTDIGSESLQKINAIFFEMASGANAALAPSSTDEMNMSLQKINALTLMIQQGGTGAGSGPSDWQNIGSTMIQFRTEPPDVARLHGMGRDTDMPASGFPIPILNRVNFAMAGITFENSPRACLWQGVLDNTGTMNLTMVYPENVPEGGEAWFDGITYVYAV